MDIYDAYYYWKNFLSVSIKEGTIPLWNPYNFSGTPFLSHPNINIFYPPNWLFFILPLNWSFSWYFYLHIIIAGINMYWLARQYTKKWGAFIAAIVFAWGGFFAARVYSGHLEYIDAASWLPLVFGLSRKALLKSSYRNIIFSGCGIGILLLAGNELFLLFILEVLGLYLIYLSVINRKVTAIINSVKVILLSLLIGFGIAAVEVLPRYQFINLSLRSQGIPYELAVSGSLPFSGLWLFLKPFYWGLPFPDNYTYRGPWPNLFEFTYYVGIVPVISSIIFIIIQILKRFTYIIFQARRIPHFVRNDKESVPKEIWFFILLVIPVFLLISFSSQIPINFHQILYKYFFFYKSIRFPVRHLLMIAFSLSIIAGIIINSIKSKLIKTFLILIIIIDLLLFDKQFFRLSDIPTVIFDKELISLFQKDKGIYRLLPDYPVVSPVRRDFDFGAATMYGIQTTSDYNSMILWRYYRFIDLANNSRLSSLPYYNVEIPPLDYSSEYIDFLNIKYILLDKQYSQMSKQIPDKYKMLRQTDRYMLYENPNYSQRYFFVDNARIYPDEKAIEEAILQNPIDLTKTVLLLKNDFGSRNKYDLDCQINKNGEIDIISYQLNKIILNVKSSCNTFLSSSDIYYPGWKARIDNLESKIYLSNFTFRSIYLPKGEHKVEFYYAPDIFYIGGFVTLITVVTIIIFYKKNEK